MKQKNNAPIRILHITEVLSAAGIESFIMNNYRRIDRTKVQFDFLVLRNQKEFYDDEIKKMGGGKYWVHSYKGNTLLRVFEETKKIYSFLKKNKYDIVHIHYTTPLRAPYLFAAKKAGVQTRIYHSHSAYITGKSLLKKIIYSIMRKSIYNWATHYFACSESAAKWMYNKKTLKNKNVEVLFNGIDVKKFTFNTDKRKQIRRDLNIDDKFVLINTGRFEEQKNQSFVVEVFKKFHEKEKNSCLLLLGTGDLVEKVKQKVKDYGLSKNVIFLGVKQNVSDYLSAADCYIMPSLYEGLPVAAVEAQCEGLPCVFSENITKEVKLCNNVSFLPLESPIEDWVSRVQIYMSVTREEDAPSKTKNEGYYIQDCAKKLQNFYIQKVEEMKNDR